MPTRKELANAIRALAMDAVQRAKSGHPGAPMGMADMAEVVWNDFLVHNPANPKWSNRDRFVLSNGHASMLLYAVLHLSGYDLSIEDLRNFRQLVSKTPGHPEHGVTPGVETTTGPLGQGIANAVGMALAEKLMATRFNKPKFEIIDHYTYAFVGDGCLMEGISHEACSLAGTLKLGKLITLWDNNGISIDGTVAGWFAENTLERFDAYGWHVQEVDGHDGEAIKKAIQKAKKVLDKPSFISCKTHIACCAPTKQDTAASHGSPLGDEEISGAKRNMGWKYPAFEIPAEIRTDWDARLRGQNAEKKWNKLFENYKKEFAKEAKLYEHLLDGELEPDWRGNVLEMADKYQKEGLSQATRVSSQLVLNEFGKTIPSLIGGSADLSGSVLTSWKGSKAVTPEDFSGNYINYGVREFAMGAIMNGMALHGGFMPYAGTFLVFSDYAKNAIRLSAMMEAQVIWVLTHDSIGVGEDGPTHQPVEQLVSLRSIPGNRVWRPCDIVETSAAWIDAVRTHDAPSCMVLSRQNLNVQNRDRTVLCTLKQVQEPTGIEKIVKTIRRGGYVLRDPKKGDPEVILIATGSEVGLASEAADTLEERGTRVRVVSMPCPEVFDAQDVAWRASVLPPEIKARVAIEAAYADYWTKYVGLDGAVIGMRSFGKSAPGNVLFNQYGFTADNVVKTVEKLIGSKDKTEK